MNRTILALMFTAMACSAGAACPQAKSGGSVRQDPTRPLLRQGKDTWGWWARCGQHHNYLLTNDAFDVVFVGDSITHGWEGRGRKVLNELSREFKILNLGYAGDRTETVLWRFRCAEQLKGYKTKAFMLMIGINNLVGNPSCAPADAAAGVRAVIDDIRAAHPESKILLMGLLPHGKKPNPQGGAAQTNRLIEKFADGENVVYLDCWNDFVGADGRIPDGVLADGLHPSEKGYRIWRDAALPILRRFCENNKQVKE